MTEHADQTLVDDAELIELLRGVAKDGGPPLRHGIEHVVAEGRRARRRRRVLMVPASSVAIIGVVALLIAMARAGTNDRLFLSPSSSGTLDSPRSTGSTAGDLQILQEAFGDDFVVGPGGETGPTPGNVTVRPGSASADGLPAGVTLWTQLLYGGRGGIPVGQLEEFCAPMIEKGSHRAACTQRVLPGGHAVHVQASSYYPGEYKPAAPHGVDLPADEVRVIYAQSNGQLVIVDLVATEDASSSTLEGRSAVRAWLDGMTSRLAAAATDPRIDALS
ncbi:MAG: hypothetical protein LC750_18875 [Actinobacteria bacterium]|nr:hypothetical protein [Actinomycetota bacterium]